jgi:hypothetical protein
MSEYVTRNEGSLVHGFWGIVNRSCEGSVLRVAGAATESSRQF